MLKISLRQTVKTALASALIWSSASQAAVIDVLWVSGSDAYNANITELATAASSHDPDGNGSNDWNLTFWDSVLNPNPDFSLYDVLVIGSFQTGSFNLGSTPNGVLANKNAIEAARGNRTLLTGQDADWHDLNNLPNQPDGPEGFMINSVNWAGSGDGLGIFSMPDQFGSSGWWLDDDSFLRDELVGQVSYFNDNSVFLGVGQEGFPINEGITTAGLSGWNTSSHLAFATDIAGYVGINYEGGNSSGRLITIVTAGQEDGGTSGGEVPPSAEVSAPSSLALFGLGLVLTGVSRKRKSNAIFQQ